MVDKVIRLSDDAGVTWENLPGSEGEFNSSVASLNDTIFNQSFESNESGLETFNMSSNAFFKGFAGYKAEIKKTGSTTVADGEAMSLESGKIYKITNATKNIWDRTDTVVVYDTAVDKTAEVEWIDYLFGRIKFKDSYTVTGAVTADVSYFPTATLAKANSYTLSMGAGTKETSDFDTVQTNGGWRTHKPGLRTVSLELSGLFDAALDASTLLGGRAEHIIEIDPAGDGSSIARGFFKYSNISQSGPLGSIEEESLNFMLTVPEDDLLYIPFNWLHTATTLHASIQIALDAFIAESDTIEAQYLPSGIVGATPNDGKEGVVIFTGITLAGGIDNMNIFSIEMLGSGAVTIV